MEWTAVRLNLLGALGFDLEITGSFGKSKSINLTMAEGSPRMLQFTTLGSGSMKRVVRVNGENWVLALAGDSLAADSDMRGEVRTLVALAEDGVRVPQPFPNGIVDQIIFNLDIFNTDINETKTYPAFLQQYLPYQEMDKLKDRAEFAKDFILKGGTPASINTTIADLKAILASLKRHEWGDFQVLYDKASGYVYTFDPLPENNSGVSSVPLVERWLSDIDTALKKAHRPVTASKSAGGSWEV